MRSIFNELAIKHGFRQVAAEEYESFRDLHGTELLKALDLPLWKVPAVMNDMRKRMAARDKPFSLFDGIPEALERLSRSGMQLAIVSSNTRQNVERILGPTNASLINHFNCGASLFGKANKIKTVVRASNVAANTTIYIGDEVRDGEAARKAGVAFGAVAWGQHRPETLQKQNPAETFEYPAQIADKLCAANS